jgi:hypothetical protein
MVADASISDLSLLSGPGMCHTLCTGQGGSLALCLVASIAHPPLPPSCLPFKGKLSSLMFLEGVTDSVLFSQFSKTLQPPEQKG